MIDTEPNTEVNSDSKTESNIELIIEPKTETSTESKTETSFELNSESKTETSFELNSELNPEVNEVINRYWKPNPIVLQNIQRYCETKEHKLILEIGPGFEPFVLATDFIGRNEKITNYSDIDIDKDIFPYENEKFDFIYCRHVLEDIQNPDFALNEITRVTKYGGYIETPSPLIEVTKNVDGSGFSNSYCGYIHHRYIVWSNIQKNEIYFLPKYSCILDNILNFHNTHVYNIINNFPIYWNNYFVFETKPTVIMYKNGVNFNVGRARSAETMVEEYVALISRAVNESIQNTDYFINTFCKI